MPRRSRITSEDNQNLSRSQRGLKSEEADIGQTPVKLPLQKFYTDRQKRDEEYVHNIWG